MENIRGITVMKKVNVVKITFVVMVLLFAFLVGCGGESPDSLFETAKFEEKQANFTHAKELYHQIIRDYPDSEWTRKAKERFEALEGLYPEDL